MSYGSVLTQRNGDGLEGKAGKVSGKELSWVYTKRRSPREAKVGGGAFLQMSCSRMRVSLERRNGFAPRDLSHSSEEATNADMVPTLVTPRALITSSRPTSNTINT